MTTETMEAPAVAAPVETAPNPVAELAVDREWLTLLARLSASASDAGTSIGWMTHDASGTAEQARLIAAASEELAATTGEIAAKRSDSVATRCPNSSRTKPKKKRRVRPVVSGGRR